MFYQHPYTTYNLDETTIYQDHPSGWTVFFFYSLRRIRGLLGGHEGCEYKRQHLERQIDYARAHNNTHREAGLQGALSRVDEYCTDNWLLKRKENKVAEKQRKVAKRQQELEQARASGKPRKIADKQKNLDEARDELAKARLELNR
ncbi:DUF1090 domain-containing protein [Salmonella enterica]|nr:DUF1090 domain-containing protein [Salmonella enterica]